MVYDYKTLEKALTHWNARTDAESEMIDLMLEVMDKYADCDNCEEICEINELQDTDGCLHGGIGKVCPQCWEDLDIQPLATEEI